MLLSRWCSFQAYVASNPAACSQRSSPSARKYSSLGELSLRRLITGFQKSSGTLYATSQRKPSTPRSIQKRMLFSISWRIWRLS